MRNIIFKILTFNLVWVLTFLFVIMIMAHSDCRVGYGFAIGYAISLMYAYFFAVNKMKYFIYSLLLYIIFGILFVIINYPIPVYYKDIPDKISLYFLTIIFLKAIMFNSPIIIAMVITKIKGLPSSMMKDTL